MKHKHQFYPTGEWRYPPEVYNNMSSNNSCYLDYSLVPKEHKLICECGEIKWVRENNNQGETMDGSDSKESSSPGALCSREIQDKGGVKNGKNKRKD